ncbi:MAG: hypothetical protein AAF639_23875, partial [Chloroflexota bacterium]
MEASTTEAELSKFARSIVHTYPESLVISTVIKHLDTTSSQLRGGLGHIANLLPQDEIKGKLRSVVANRNNSPQIRVTGALILERFLGENLPPALVADLDNTSDVAFQSLCEALEEAKTNRHILIEYVTQMHEAGPNIAYMVLDMLQRLPVLEQLPLLEVLAQDNDEPVADAAMNALVTMATAEANSDEDEEITQRGAEGARASLHMLRFALPPAKAQVAERTLRRLQFRGKRHTPASQDHWYALMSPADPSGSQSIWILYNAPDNTPRDSFDPILNRQRPTTNVLLGFLVNHGRGIMQLFADETVPDIHFPAFPDIGQKTTMNLDGRTPTELLRIPLDYARWLLQRALHLHWEQASTPLVPTNHASGESTSEPAVLPLDYKVYCGFLWQFDKPTIAPNLKEVWAEMESNRVEEDLKVADDSNKSDVRHTISLRQHQKSRTEPNSDKAKVDEEVINVVNLEEIATNLLQHPAMSEWVFQSPVDVKTLIKQEFNSIFTQNSENRNVSSVYQYISEPYTTFVQWILNQIAQSSQPEQALLIHSLSLGLRAQSAWL